MLAMPQTQRTTEADLTPKTSQSMNLQGLERTLPPVQSQPLSNTPGTSMMSIIRESLARTAQEAF